APANRPRHVCACERARPMSVDATPLLRLYARRRLAMLAREDAVAAQTAQLLRLVRAAQETRLRAAHDVAPIHRLPAVRTRAPLRRYDDFWTRYWKPAFPRIANATWPGTIPCFAVTSGTTTGATKYIPVTKPMSRANRSAALDLLAHHIANRPRSRVMAGRN